MKFIPIMANFQRFWTNDSSSYPVQHCRINHLLVNVKNNALCDKSSMLHVFHVQDAFVLMFCRRTS